MIDPPLVSVVIPVFRPEAFFLETLQSVLSQSSASFEVIISDDQPESFPENIRELIDIDHRVKYVANPGSKGIFSNLNNAIHHARGTYLQIFCQDDVMHPGMLEAQVAGLKRYPEAGMIFCGRDVIDEIGEIIKKGPSGEPKYRFNSAELAINKYVSRGSVPGNLSPVMLRREAMEQTGLFDAGMKYAGDFEYWMRFAQKGFGYVYSSNTFLAVRQHKGQASHNLSKSILLKEQTAIYQELLKIHTIKRSNFFCRLFLNQQVGLMHFRFFLKGGYSREYGKQLNTFPFSMILIIFLFFASLNGRIKWFKIEEGRDY